MFLTLNVFLMFFFVLFFPLTFVVCRTIQVLIVFGKCFVLFV
ncbi:hypothetical protein BDA96_01G210900 [Sorghum bicolor]|uniref:Uncharacterized protein n=1 Tax=Sorghum bicolor TaxID=4558 RepID=A0A921V0T7_SORBI|nr:hypothetical protein BDA96_01G210900 [Sorghum bicolor]